MKLSRSWKVFEDNRKLREFISSKASQDRRTSAKRSKIVEFVEDRMTHAPLGRK